MDTPDFKTLKKLADACRKAGIETFKGFGFEFTLSSSAPLSNYKTKKAAQPSYSGLTDPPFESDSLSEDDLLFYSVQDGQATQLAESE